MAGLYEADQAVPVKDYGDELFVVQSHETPKMRLMGTGSKMTQMLQEWEAESRQRVGFSGVKDGEAIAAYNAQTAKAMIAYGSYLREAIKVTKVMSLTSTAGIKDQWKHQRIEALKRIREAMERQFGSTVEMQRGASNAEYNQRGAFAWLIASLQSVNAVDSSLMPASACIHTAALSALDADAFEDMIAAAAAQVGHAVNLQGFVGPTLKSHMSSWGQKATLVDVSGSSVHALQQFSIAASEKRLIKMVNTFEFDHGTVEVMPDYNLACDSTTGADSAYTPYSGLFLDMEVWKKRFLQPVSEWELPDDATGKRGYVDVLWMAKCGMPAGQMAVYTNAAS